MRAERTCFGAHLSFASGGQPPRFRHAPPVGNLLSLLQCPPLTDPNFLYVSLLLGRGELVPEPTALVLARPKDRPRPADVLRLHRQRHVYRGPAVRPEPPLSPSTATTLVGPTVHRHPLIAGRPHGSPVGNGHAHRVADVQLRPRPWERSRGVLQVAQCSGGDRARTSCAGGHDGEWTWWKTSALKTTSTQLPVAVWMVANARRLPRIRRFVTVPETVLVCGRAAAAGGGATSGSVAGSVAGGAATSAARRGRFAPASCAMRCCGRATAVGGGTAGGGGGSGHCGRTFRDANMRPFTSGRISTALINRR